MNDENTRRSKRSADRRINKIVLIVFVVLLVIIIFKGSISVLELKSQEREISKDYDKILEQKADLEEELQYINTPEYLEQKARDMLKMVMPGEILYIIRDKNVDPNDTSGLFLQDTPKPDVSSSDISDEEDSTEGTDNPDSLNNSDSDTNKETDDNDTQANEGDGNGE